MKESMMTEEMHAIIEADIHSFIETYAPLEKAILSHVNKELEILNAQIRSYLSNKEIKLKDQEMREIEQEIAYL